MNNIIKESLSSWLTESKYPEHITAGAAIYDKDGKILIFKHVKINKYTIPVGKADPGETAVQAIIREVREELGIKILNLKEVSVNNFDYKKWNMSVEFHLFEVLKYSGVPKNIEPHKHSEMLWLELKDVKKLEPKSDALKTYLNKKEREEINSTLSF
jgi:mutator protein MutT